jgi:HEPN domain-containing protein
MKVCESFNDWLGTGSINESIFSAKIFMQKKYANRLRKNLNELSKEEQDKALSDPDYLKIVNLVNPWPGYMLSFVKFHFEQGIPILDPRPRDENSIIDLNDLIEVIKNKKYIIQQLPKTIDQYANAGKVGNANGFEQLTDEIRKIERFKEAKWFIDALPRPLRDQYRSLNSEKQDGLITSAIILSKSGKSSIDRLFKKIKAMANWPIEDFIEYTANYIKGLENSDMASKIKELEDLSPEAGILYSDGQYLVLSMRTEEAQKKLCSIANWCINRGSFHTYANKGIQINIFNFGTDVTDPLFLTGTTIAFNKAVTDSHDINDKDIKRTTNPVIHFQNLGYPKVLVDSIIDNFNTECDIKNAISALWEKTKGLNSKKIIESLFQATRGFLSGSMSEDEWGKIAGVVAEIISEDKGINKRDFMNHFKEHGIISDAGFNVFNSLIGDDYTKGDIEDILKATEEVIGDIKYVLDGYEKGKSPYLDEPEYKDLLGNLRKTVKEEQNIIKKIKAKL